MKWMLSIFSVFFVACDGYVPVQSLVMEKVSLHDEYSLNGDETTFHLERVQESFRHFVAELSPDDLEGGNCVGHSQRFVDKLMREGIPVKDLRIVLLVREPNRGMPQPMVPNEEYVRGNPVRFWIWHAIVMIDGHIFDPKYRDLFAPISEYRKTMWSSDSHLASAWLFSVLPHQISQIAGSDYPGGPAKMLRFIPVSFDDLIEDSDHVTVRK